MMNDELAEFFIIHYSLFIKTHTYSKSRACVIFSGQNIPFTGNDFLLPVMLLLWYHRKQSKKGIYPADGIVVMIKVAFSGKGVC